MGANFPEYSSTIVKCGNRIKSIWAEISIYQISIRNLQSDCFFATGCIPNGSGGCLYWTALNRPNQDLGTVNLDLQQQVDIYDAMFSAINARTWVSGLISRGYFAPVPLQDKSASIHGKPAADLVWYWFPRLLGNIK